MLEDKEKEDGKMGRRTLLWTVRLQASNCDTAVLTKERPYDKLKRGYNPDLPHEDLTTSDLTRNDWIRVFELSGHWLL